MEPKKEMMYIVAINLLLVVVLSIGHDPVYNLFHISLTQKGIFVISAILLFFYAKQAIPRIINFSKVMSLIYLLIFAVTFIIDKNDTLIMETNSFLYLFLFSVFFYLSFGKNSNDNYWNRIG